MSSRQIIIFARAPIPGRCKTRLIPRLGGRGAARVQTLLMQRSLAHAAHADARVELSCAPHGRHGSLLRQRRGTALRLVRQPDGELGTRMSKAINQALRASTQVLLSGSDCLNQQREDFQQGFAALENGADYVIQAAEDGGYVMLGARRAIPLQLLRGVSWSSGREFRQTRDRLLRHGSVAELPPRVDLDDARDWHRGIRNQWVGMFPHGPKNRAAVLTPS